MKHVILRLKELYLADQLIAAVVGQQEEQGLAEASTDADRWSVPKAEAKLPE